MSGDPFPPDEAGMALRNLRATIKRGAASVRRRLGFRQAEARDVDFEQSFLRTVLGSAVLFYALYLGVTTEEGFEPGLRLGVIAAALVVLAGVIMMWWMKRHRERPASMRYVGIAADIIPMTIGLWGAGELGVPVVGIYLWVTVGNGFRYGTRYLLVAYVLSLVCYSLLVLFVPYWQEHRGIGIGYLGVLATIPLYVLVLLSRITAQKDAAVELLNAKTRFVANVSHELRTPLTGVYAVYELFRRRRLTPDERELVASLGSAIATLKSSVDAVLQSSKLEAGAEKTNPRLFNLRHFLWQFAVLVRPQAAAKRLAWRLEIDRAVPGTVYGDWEHLQHILGNLVNNALKFTPTGSVRLTVSKIAGGVRFSVSDTGIGIPMEAQETLFERFVQVDNSPTRKYGGTGLGTSIAADLTRLMGGLIGVQSAPGRGSTFWVDLPLADNPVAVVPMADFAVLLIGDDDAACEGLADTFAAVGLHPKRYRTSEQPNFATSEYLAAALVMPPVEAARYGQQYLQEQSGAICPWFVVSSDCTALQEAALLNIGAVGVFQPTLRPSEWRHHLAALANRIDLPSAESDSDTRLAVTRPLHILLADDNESNQLLLARILRDAGHRVSSVSNGTEAFDRMVEGDIELAILDLNMPDMSGPDVIKLYRAGEVGGGKKLPIIIFSADATPAAREDSLAAGANDYMTKPITAAALLAMIERLVAAMPAPAPTNEAAPVAPAPSGPETRPQLVLAATLPAPSAPLRANDSAAPVLVDPERIEALRRIVRHDRAFLDQYVRAAFDDIEAAVGELRKAVHSGDTRSARDALHKVEGTSASIGASALLANTKAMRQYVTETMDSDAAVALAELTSTCALTKSAVRALLAPEQSGLR